MDHIHQGAEERVVQAEGPASAGVEAERVASWGTTGRVAGTESLNSEWQERVRSVERKPETTSAKSCQLQKDPEKKPRGPGGRSSRGGQWLPAGLRYRPRLICMVLAFQVAPHSARKWCEECDLARARWYLGCAPPS